LLLAEAKLPKQPAQACLGSKKSIERLEAILVFDKGHKLL
jgi:hypothetical protein